MPQPLLPAIEARERFLASIAEAVPAERLVELHFFRPIRQGPVETGVAVIAALPAGAGGPPLAIADAAEAETAPMGDSTGAVEAVTAREGRHVVLSARYRWTRKGPERGKWEQEVVAEADAPLVTVEAVVRGVRERANEELEPERMTGDEARALLAEAEARRLRASA